MNIEDINAEIQGMLDPNAANKINDIDKIIKSTEQNLNDKLYHFPIRLKINDSQPALDEFSELLAAKACELPGR